MKLSNIIKASVCVFGLVATGNFLAAPANAGDAAARAAATVSRADGITQTVSGESVLPSGSYFGGTAPTLLVTPVFSGAGTASETFNTTGAAASLTFAAGAAVTTVSANTVEAAVAARISGLAIGAVQDTAAYIKAAGGVNGFGGLD